MDILKAIETRHSVREFLDKPLTVEVQEKLNKYLEEINQQAQTHFQLVTQAGHVFENHYKPNGHFEHAENFIALISENHENLEETIGYYGQKVVLFAQSLGLNTCWIASTFTDDPTLYQLNEGESLIMVIAVGYGSNPGNPHKNKSIEELYEASGELPDWFKQGLEAVLQAPTARNQQQFRLVLQEDGVKLVDLGGRWSKVDLGIVKLHFELGSKGYPFKWV